MAMGGTQSSTMMYIRNLNINAKDDKHVGYTVIIIFTEYYNLWFIIYYMDIKNYRT